MRSIPRSDQPPGPASGNDRSVLISGLADRHLSLYMIRYSETEVLVRSFFQRRLFALLVAALAISGSAPAAERAPVVLAAASLQEALTEAAETWAANGNPRPVLSFAASPALARQIQLGAPADLFISADEAWMEYLVDKRLIAPGTKTAFLGNRLVLIAPAGSRAHLRIMPGFPLARALGNGRLAIADPASVPAGKYGKAALEYFDVWGGVAEKLARVENVRAALALAERSEVPFAIVYATDAVASKRVRIVARFPANSHAHIRYPIARIATSTNPAAEKFRRFLISATGRAIFVRRGFSSI